MELLHYITVSGVDVEKYITQTIVPTCRMYTSCDTSGGCVFQRDIVEWLEQQSIDLKGFTTLSIKIQACDAATLQPVYDAHQFVAVESKETLVFSWAGDRVERQWSDLENGVRADEYASQRWVAFVDGVDGRFEVVPSIAVLNCIKNGVFSVSRIQGPEVKRTLTFIPFN